MQGRIWKQKVSSQTVEAYFRSAQVLYYICNREEAQEKYIQSGNQVYQSRSRVVFLSRYASKWGPRSILAPRILGIAQNGTMLQQYGNSVTAFIVQIHEASDLLVKSTEI
jgi:hypothetical protein